MQLLLKNLTEEAKKIKNIFNFNIFNYLVLAVF